MSKIPQEILDILSQGVVEEDRYFLPDVQLDGDTYTKCNKVLSDANGKWSRKEKCHLFSKGTGKLVEFLESGASISEKKLLQKFYTPLSLVERIVNLADVKGKTVLEPSCGDGRVMRECLKQGAKEVFGIDVMPEDCDDLDVVKWDFLQVEPQVKYDVAVGNPPFCKNQWISHTQHAYEFVKDGGKLVFILPDSPNPKFYEWIIDKNYKIHPVEEKSFKEAGTLVRTVILELFK